jgi:D-glycero-D-manno-heptose 1,7-bisphosphate phosphatase
VKLPPVFLDRDGVINRNRADYVRRISHWVPYPGAFESMARLTEAGLPIVVVTNQSAIGRGYTTREVVEQVHALLLKRAAEAGARVSGVYYCPHRPDEGCGCRKPATGMVESARRELGLPGGGWIVGDAATDMELGRAAGLRTLLVLTGRGGDQLDGIRDSGAPEPWAICDGLDAAVTRILDDLAEASG